MADGTGLFSLSNCDGHALVWEGGLGGAQVVFLVRTSLIAASLPLRQRNENDGDIPFPF